jgi:hypothetical protein
MFRLFSPAVLCVFLALRPAAALEARSDIVAGTYDAGTNSINDAQAVNLLVGAGIFYQAGYFGQSTLVANVEAGHVWGGHDVFDRSAINAEFPLGLPASPELLYNATRDPVTAPELGDIDFHATMVGHVLAGTGYAGNGDLSLIGAGMAPYATLWSGAIATTFDHAEANIGAFEISDESFLAPYRAFFEGSLGRKPDVINSSWGFDDPAGTAKETLILDGLAAENASVTFVKSAGNSGPTSAPGGPGSGYNGITVGSLGGLLDANPFLRPSDFSSGAPADFHDPVTNTTVSGVRAAVSISAPGENLALAAYLSKSGSLAELEDVIGPDGNPASDLFFVEAGGTSFAAPVVAGGVALLKDVSYTYFPAAPESRDTRVIKSVLMAGATPTTGWDNGQHDAGGVITTTQALDYATGAGRMNLEDSAAIFVGGTTDVPGDAGGSIESIGWDIGIVALAGANDYFFDLAASAGAELAVSLNWFVDVDFDGLTETGLAQRFADLDLEVWIVSGGLFATKIAESATLYNNSEFLRFVLPQDGQYGLRVTFDNVRYDFTGSTAGETYGIAWKMSSVPEPGEWGALVAGVLLLAILARRRAKFVS